MTRRKQGNRNGDDVYGPETTATKASVHEAIGKLIGDDAAQREGNAAKKAGHSDADTSR
jgi:hypothetical protein